MIVTRFYLGPRPSLVAEILNLALIDNTMKLYDQRIASIVSAIYCR